VAVVVDLLVFVL